MKRSSLDRSCSHLHTSEKHFGCNPWLHGHWQQHMSVLPLSPRTHGLRPTKLYTSIAVTPASVQHLPEFHVGCRLGRELFTLPVCYCLCLWSHGLQPKKFYCTHRVERTSCPIRVPTQQPLVQSFT